MVERRCISSGRVSKYREKKRGILFKAEGPNPARFVLFLTLSAAVDARLRILYISKKEDRREERRKAANFCIRRIEL